LFLEFRRSGIYKAKTILKLFYRQSPTGCDNEAGSNLAHKKLIFINLYPFSLLYIIFDTDFQPAQILPHFGTGRIWLTVGFYPYATNTGFINKAGCILNRNQPLLI